MPYIALNEYDQEVTSFQCLDEFRREGTEYQRFRCPFCEVDYIAKGIYNGSKIGKAPHFSLGKGGKHVGNCDGDVLMVAPAVDSVKLTRKVVKREFEVPEVLVAKPSKRAVTLGPKGGPALPPSEEEIKRRRRRAAEKYGVARFSSSLLASFIEAKAHLVTEGFKQAEEQGLEGADKGAFVSTFSSSYPLQLFEQKLTYASAFWRANYPRIGRSERIFQAVKGVVEISSNGFTITSTPAATKSSKLLQSLPEKAAASAVTAVVSFDMSAVDSSALPRGHKRLLQQLTEAQLKSGHVDWNAYGTMVGLGGRNCIELMSLDHLHIKS